MYSESDLQAMLYEELFEMDNLYPTNMSSQEKKLNTTRVHAEYPYCFKHEEKRQTHDIDIGVFAKEYIVNASMKSRSKSQLGNLFVLDPKLVRTDSEKRSIFCSHLIELKVPPRETINFYYKTPKKKSKSMLGDFEFLRLGFENYKFLNQKYKITPQLYFFCFIFWRAVKTKTIINQVQQLVIAHENAKLVPKINFYVLIGPKKIWCNAIKKSDVGNLINEYIFLF